MFVSIQSARVLLTLRCSLSMAPAYRGNSARSIRTLSA